MRIIAKKALVDFIRSIKILYIQFVGTHKEYDDIENIDKI